MVEKDYVGNKAHQRKRHRVEPCEVSRVEGDQAGRSEGRSSIVPRRVAWLTRLHRFRDYSHLQLFFPFSIRPDQAAASATTHAFDRSAGPSQYSCRCLSIVFRSLHQPLLTAVLPGGIKRLQLSAQNLHATRLKHDDASSNIKLP